MHHEWSMSLSPGCCFTTRQGCTCSTGGVYGGCMITTLVPVLWSWLVVWWSVWAPCYFWDVSGASCFPRTTSISTADPICFSHATGLEQRWVRAFHDDVINRKYFSYYWPFVGGIHRSPVNSHHKGKWHGAMMFSFICVWINNREAGDLRRYRAHYDVIVMCNRYRDSYHKDKIF